DLVGGDVELVVAPVLEQQVVALDPADGPLHHAAVPGDAVLVVHDVVARLEVVEEAGGVGAATAGHAVGAAPSGEVALAEEGELQVGEDDPTLERRDDEVEAGSEE